MPEKTQALSDRLPITDVLAYGPPIAGVSALLFFVTFFVMNFGTDYLGIAPAVVGTIFGIGRIWDAVADPIVGTWSDRVRTRWGRRRPFLLAATPVIAVAILLVYAPPMQLEGNALLVWFALALFLFYTGVTAYLIPHQALGSELIRGYHDRTRVFGVRAVFFQLGLISAFALMQVVVSAGTGGTDIPAARDMAGDVALSLSIGCGLILLIPIVFLREPQVNRPKARATAFESVQTVFRNAHARIVLVVTFVEMLGLGVLGTLAPYYGKYILQRDDLVGLLPAISVGSAMLSVPIWVWLSRRYGKKLVWLVSMLGVAVGFGLLGTVQAGAVNLAMILMGIAGFASGCGYALGPSVLADVIDADEYETGERNEGAYSAAYGFAIKSGGAIVIFIVGWVLQASGFVANQIQQAYEAELAIRLLIGALPFIAYIVGALVFSRYQLSEARHLQIRHELSLRTAGIEKNLMTPGSMRARPPTIDTVETP